MMYHPMGGHKVPTGDFPKQNQSFPRLAIIAQWKSEKETVRWRRTISREHCMLLIEILKQTIRGQVSFPGY